MLRVTRLSVQPVRALTVQALRASGPHTIGKRYNGSAQLAKDEPKKGRSLVRTLVTVALVGTAAYSGAVYYSFKNESFRDTFTSYVFGADAVIDYIDELERSDNFRRIRDQAVIVRNEVSKISSKITEVTSGTINKVKEQVDNGPAKAPIEYTKPKPKPAAIPPSPPRKAKDLVISATTNLAAAEKAVSDTLVSTADPIFTELGNTIDELASIFKNSEVADNGEKFIQTARNELSRLKSHVATLKKEDQTRVEEALKKQAEQIKEYISDFGQQTSDTVARYEHELNERLARLQREADQRVAIEVLKQKASDAEELANALVAQAIDMERRWIREVKYRVENERAGRLAGLDRISARLRVLERFSLDNAEWLDESSRAHRAWIALRALKDIVTSPHKTPFAEELASLRDLTTMDPVAQAVLGSIPDTVSEQGIDPLTHLTARFEVVSNEVRRVALVPEDGGFVSHVLSLALSKLLFKKHGLVEGDDVEAVLARVEWYLKEGDVNMATREMNQLKGWPKKLAADWLDAARRHLEVKQAVEILETEACVSSLLQA